MSKNVLVIGLLLPLVGCTGLESARPGAQTLAETFAPPTPAEAARMALDTENADNRFRGTMLLANAPWGGEDVYLRMYEDYADEEVPNVRAAAIRALGNHGDPTHVEYIVPSLDHEDPLVRLESVQALQRLHNPMAIDGLMARLDPNVEDDVDVRAETAHALGQYASRDVVQRLIGAIDDRALSVNHNALLSLQTLTGENFGLNRVRWLEWFTDTGEPFEGQTAYIYPVFYRDKRWIEYIPFFPPPPNEEPRSPVGMPEIGSENL